ncbi:MAG: hypothetical protein F6K21_28795 [Symploca sp. SIO2D2]|nr:hypothetical protein [Symploca sp. SIO2D2]
MTTKTLFQYMYRSFCVLLMLGVLFFSSLPAHAVDYPNSNFLGLQVPVKEFEASVVEKLAKSAGMSIETIDASSLRVSLEPGSIVATVTSQDGRTGLFLSPGRKAGTVIKQAPGLYSMTRAYDGSIDIKLEGKTIPLTPVEPPEEPIVYNFFRPFFFCGGWADPVLANACFFKATCLWTGVFCDTPPQPPQ